MDHRFILTVAILALLAGCDHKADCPFSGCGVGGPVGGGAGLMTVDENNALPALREAWFAANATAELPFFVAATGVGEVLNPLVIVDPAGPTAYNCPVSGTFIVSSNVADPNTVTAGDFVSYESSACDSANGFTVDGTHSLDILSIVGDPSSGQFEQAQTLAFSNFQAASATTVTTLNGDHTDVIDSQSASSVSTAFSGNLLLIDEDQISISISNYSGFSFIQIISPFASDLESVGNANSSVITGSFDYWTDEPILQLVGANPHDGILEIFGRDGGTARIAIVDEFSVDIQVDANATGNYESSTNLTWDQFLGLAPLP